jgi:hypothetical protein
MFIPDPRSDFLPSRIRVFSISDPGSASKNLSILPKKWQVRNPSWIPDLGVKKAPDPGSATLRNRKSNPLFIYSTSERPEEGGPLGCTGRRRGGEIVHIAEHDGRGHAKLKHFTPIIV